MKYDRMIAHFDKKKAQRKNRFDKAMEQKRVMLEKDKQEAERRKKSVAEQYRKKLESIQAQEIKAIQSRFRKPYDVERKRVVDPTQITAKIKKEQAEALTRLGLRILEKEELKKAREYFVKALYINKDSKRAKEALQAIEEKAKTLYWKAYGQRDSNKSEAKKTLRNLRNSLMPTNEFFLKSKMLLDELN
ncbi:MAG: hypothetical protein R6W70_02100, partial [bacterium]